VFVCASVTPASSLAFLSRSVAGCASSPAHPGMPTGPGDRLDERPARSGLRPRGHPARGRSTLRGRCSVRGVQVRPGGVVPAGQRHRDQRADIDRQLPPSPGPAVAERSLGGPGHRGIQRRPGHIAQRPVDHGVIDPAVGGRPGSGRRLRNAIGSQGQDLVAERGPADLPRSPGGVVAFLQLDPDPDGQLLVVPGMLRGERHLGRSVPARAPRSNTSMTSRPRSSTRASTFHGTSGPNRVRPSPSSRTWSSASMAMRWAS
jgi:hypothetical protein